MFKIGKLVIYSTLLIRFTSHLCSILSKDGNTYLGQDVVNRWFVDVDEVRYVTNGDRHVFIYTRDNILSGRIESQKVTTG